MKEISNTALVSKARLFRIDYSREDEFWFIVAGVGVTTGGHFTRADIIALRDLCVKSVGEDVN